MLYRLLGKFFFLFYICPAISETIGFVLKHSSKMVAKMLADKIAEETKSTRPTSRPKPGYVPQP